MTEPKIPNVKPLIIILWASIGVAIVITLIDWKIKQDILTSITDYYNKLGLVPNDSPRDEESNPTATVRPDPVLPLRSVDHGAGMETAALVEALTPQRPARPRARNVRRGEAGNPDGVSETTVGTPDSEEPA